MKYLLLIPAAIIALFADRFGADAADAEEKASILRLLMMTDP